MGNTDIICGTDGKYGFKVKKEFYDKNVRPFKSYYETPLIENGYYMLDLDLYLREAIKMSVIASIFELVQFKDELWAKQNCFKSYLIELLNKYDIQENIFPKISVSSLSRYDITDDIIDRDVPSILDKCSIDEIAQIFVMSADVSDNILKQKKYRELMGRQDAIRESIGYLTDESVKQNLLYELNEIINIQPFDVSKLETFKSKYNEIIKNEYKKMGKVNYTPGKPFDLICHSVKSVNFDGEFHSSFVSASYINEEINDVYNLGYGFIMNPDDIFLTGEKDTMLNNWSDDIHTATISHNYSFFLHPNYIKRVNIELKKYKKEKGENGRIYNEIDLDKFRPIGIFCLTNGSKTLNDNYQGALELQQKFSNLQIVEIDLTLYKKLEEQAELKYSLIQSLNRKKTELWSWCLKYGKYYPIENDNIIMERYNLFYEKYLQLKQNKNITEDEIINLYVEYTDKLLHGNITKEEIFSDKYTEQEMYIYLESKYNFKALLIGNCLYNLKSIVEDFLDFDFNLIKNENIRTLIQTLVIIGQNVDIEILEKSLGDNHAKNINDVINMAYKIANMQENQIYENIILERDNNRTQLENLNKEKEALEYSINELNADLNIVEKAKQICDYEYYYKIAVDDYNSNLKKQDENQSLIAEQQMIVEQIKTLEDKKRNLEESIKNKNDSLNNNILSKANLLEILMVNKQSFDKKNILYKTMHKKERETLEKDILNLNSEIFSAKVNIITINSSEEKKEIDKLETEIFNLQIKFSNIELKISLLDIVPIETIKNLFKEKTGMTFEQYELELENAKEILTEKNSIHLEFEISGLTKKLNHVNEELLRIYQQNEQLETFTSRR